jgi:acyl-CoA synthetase (AMP-forming)/AMP-acid ligase II
VHSRDQGNFAGRLVRRLKEDSCLIDAATGQRVSGQDLPSVIAGFAAGFLSAGLRAGDRVLITCGLDPASTIAYLGAMYAGLVPVPVETRLLSSRGDLILAKARAQAVWTEGGGCLSTDVRHIRGMFEPRDPASLPASPRTEGDLAALMPTSGSTGIPRLVTVSHGNLIANTEAIIRSQHLGAGEKAMLIMPISYCFGASVMHTHLYHGGGVVFDSRFMFPDKVLNAINEYGCTSFAGVPLVYNVLVRRSNLKSLPMPGLRRFLQAGGALAPEIIKVIRNIVPTADFFVMYGQTEATARISCLPALRLNQKLGSAGLPLDNLEVRIFDQDGRELLAHEIGEIQVRGPSICCGYFDDPDSTARKVRDTWLKTGDIGCFDDDGYLWIKGRIDDFLKIRGFRVSIGEVEANVAAIPGVYECAATAVRHPEAGEALALFIVPDHNVTDKGEEDLSERVRRSLPPHWTCSSVTLVSELPKTTSGKIARPQLQTMA